MPEPPEKLKEKAKKYFQETLTLIEKQQFEKALEKIQKAEKYAQKSEDKSILVQIMSTKGMLVQNMCKFGDAFEYYSLSLEICIDHLEKDPQNEFFFPAFNMNINNIVSLGESLYNRGRFHLSKTCNEFIHDSCQKMMKSYPEEEFCQSYIATALNNLGTLLSEMGRIEETKEKYERALEIYENLRIKDSKNMIYLLSVGATLNNLGTLLSDMGRIEEAKEKYEKALGIYEGLRVKDLENIIYQSDVAMTLNNLGTLLSDTGLFEEAKEKYEKALEIYERLRVKDSKNILYQSDVAMTLNNLGDLLNNMGHMEEAQQKYEKALEIYEKLQEIDSENIAYQSDFAETLNGLGTLLTNQGINKEAKKRHEQALEIRTSLLKSDPENLAYQSNVAETLNDLGTLLYNMKLFQKSKEMYEKSFQIRESLLETDYKNILYRLNVGETLNNLGALLFDMKKSKEAKERYEEVLKICDEKTLEIYNESLQRLIAGKKSQATIGIIRSLMELAEIETNIHNEMNFLREGINVCKQNRDFFKKHNLNHEGNLALEAGLRAYLDFLMKNIVGEKDPNKRIQEYEKSILAVEKLEKIEKEEKNKELLASALCYLRGRKLISESLMFENPNIELIKEAKKEFEMAKIVYEKATVCYCIYAGILEVESIESLENESDLKIESIKKIVDELRKDLSTSANLSVLLAFEEIISLLENKQNKDEDEIRNKLNDQILKIDSFAVRTIFDHAGKKLTQKLTEYLKEPFSPDIEYSSWKLRIKFADPEKIKGILTIEAGGVKIFEEPLRGKKELYIHHTPTKIEGKITFKTTMYEKSVTRHIEYNEYLEPNLKFCILEHDCRNNIVIKNDILSIAVIQLKYDIIKDKKVVKLAFDKSYKNEFESQEQEEVNNLGKAKENYWKKICYILDAVKEKAKIIVFPEFSIPFEFLPKIQKYANENRIVVVAGSHYVTEANLHEYKDLFASDIGSEDLRKNICPVVIPSSKIVHSEKLLPAGVEREFLNMEGMNQGELKHIFKITDRLSLGILICFEYLDDKLRIHFLDKCDILLIPQTNPNTNRFYKVAIENLDNPQSPGNKTYIMANGIFSFEGEINGGSSGLLMTLNKHFHEEQVKKAIKGPIDEICEQFILLASINTEFNSARDISQGQMAMSTRWVPIIEEQEIIERKKNKIEKRISHIEELIDDDLETKNTLTAIIQKEMNKINEESRTFIGILQKIKEYEGERLKSLLESNALIIKKYSPLMYEEMAKDLGNLTPAEVKEKCCPVYIPIN